MSLLSLYFVIPISYLFQDPLFFHQLQGCERHCACFKRMTPIIVLACLLRIYDPIREFFIHMETSTLLVKGCTFWPMLGTNGHWAVRFVSVSHPLWHWASMYNGHLWWPVRLTSIAEPLPVALSLPVFTTYGWDSNISPSAWGTHQRFRVWTAVESSSANQWENLTDFSYKVQ